MNGKLLKKSLKTGYPVLEESRSCRWLDTNKYFQWEGEKLISDQEEYFSIYQTSVVPGDGENWYKKGYPIENIFVNDELAWVAPQNKPWGTIRLDLGCERFLSFVQLVNFNRETANGVQKFKIKLTKVLNGTWEPVLENKLENNRQTLMSSTDPFPVMKFDFNKTLARFVKFQIVSHYGNSAGLQYLHVSGLNNYIFILS